MLYPHLNCQIPAARNTVVLPPFYRASNLSVNQDNNPKRSPSNVLLHSTSTNPHINEDDKETLKILVDLSVLDKFVM